MVFRRATIEDCKLILFFIKELAIYERMLDEVVATEELLREWLFEQKKAEVIFACEDGKEIGFVFCIPNFNELKEGKELKTLILRVFITL